MKCFLYPKNIPTLKLWRSLLSSRTFVFYLLHVDVSGINFSVGCDVRVNFFTLMASQLIQNNLLKILSFFVINQVSTYGQFFLWVLYLVQLVYFFFSSITLSRLMQRNIKILHPLVQIFPPCLVVVLSFIGSSFLSLLFFLFLCPSSSFKVSPSCLLN